MNVSFLFFLLLSLRVKTRERRVSDLIFIEEGDTDLMDQEGVSQVSLIAFKWSLA